MIHFTMYSIHPTRFLIFYRKKQQIQEGKMLYIICSGVSVQKQIILGEKKEKNGPSIEYFNHNVHGFD